jgi:glucose/arabinose dehydrogenase
LSSASFRGCLAHRDGATDGPFENGTPIAPAGFEPQPIPAEAIEYDTAEVMRIRVVPVARGLANPWSLAFLPDGSML